MPPVTFGMLDRIVRTPAMKAGEIKLTRFDIALEYERQLKSAGVPYYTYVQQTQPASGERYDNFFFTPDDPAARIGRLTALEKMAEALQQKKQVCTEAFRQRVQAERTRLIEDLSRRAQPLNILG